MNSEKLFSCIHNELCREQGWCGMIHRFFEPWQHSLEASFWLFSANRVHVVVSDSTLAELSFRSPRNIFIFITSKDFVCIKACFLLKSCFWKQEHGLLLHGMMMVRQRWRRTVHSRGYRVLCALWTFVVSARYFAKCGNTFCSISVVPCFWGLYISATYSIGSLAGGYWIWWVAVLGISHLYSAHIR